ncbi:class I SAM-dependent methyltransferase [Candidatus Woesearchaeota archaeon]|nr:class I SAM-dependent methyltransferase [Candidatus Woesearchaeota archaeon]
MKENFEKIYEKPGAVWTKESPPAELKELVEIGKIKPCKAIDIGCGEGFYSIYLASKGFDVTGIDFSEKAIEYAKENAKKQGVNVRFIVMDIADLSELKEKFDFVFEWGVLHHIMPPQRQKYVEDVNNLLDDGGKYLSVCFNEQSPEFGKAGEKYRIAGTTGNKLYYSSQEELKELFKPYFQIIETKIIKMSGGGKIALSHLGNYFFMEK